MAFDLKRLAKDKRVWAVAGIGGGVGLLVLLRRGGQPAPTGEQDEQGLTGSATLGPQAFIGSPGIDLANAVQDATEGLRDQLSQLSAQNQDILSKLPQLPSTAPPAPPRPRSVPKWHGTRISRRMTLRDLARRYAGNPANPTSVEATLRAIGAHPANRWLRGRGGGEAVLKPGQVVVVP